MAPNRPTAVDADAAKKRKRDKAEDREDRKARKKQKSKSKSHLNANTDQVGEVQPGNSTSDKGLVLAQSNASLSVLDMVQKEGAQVEGSSVSWKVSKPIGGRMIDLDPIFSPDEE